MWDGVAVKPVMPFVSNRTLQHPTGIVYQQLVPCDPLQGEPLRFRFTNFRTNCRKGARKQKVVGIQPEKPLAMGLSKPLVQRVALPGIWLRVAILDDYFQIIV